MGSVMPHVHTVPNQSTLQSQLFYPFSISVEKKKKFSPGSHFANLYWTGLSWSDLA